MSTIQIGVYQELAVTRRKDFGVYLGWPEDEVLLPIRQVPEGTVIGDVIRVFVYCDSEDRPVATTQTPRLTAGSFAAVEVVDVTPHGVFVDIGLERDLLVPFGTQHDPLAQGDRVVVFMSVHEATQRLIGSTRLAPHFQDDAGALAEGQQVELLVYAQNDAGVQVVINRAYRGIAYHDQIFSEVHIGQALTGWVRQVRDDGLVDVSLQRVGLDAVTDARVSIMEALQLAGGFLPVHDKSDPVEIQATLQMSKKVFKRAIGGLYRDGLLKLESDGIRLVFGAA